MALDAHLARDVRDAEGILEDLRHHTRDAATRAALAHAFEAFLAAGRTIATTHVSTSGASGVRLGLLARLLESWVGGDVTARVGRLMAGLDGVASAAPTLALEAIAETAPADPEAALAPVLEAHGHRGLSEGELRAPSWREDPRPLVEALRALMAAGRPAALSHRAAAASREAEEQASLFRLGPLRRAVLQRAIAGAQEWVRARERTKSLAVGLVDEGRRLARRAGDLLARDGVLETADDVFFLEAGELVRALNGHAPPRAVVRRRRRRHAAAAEVPAPRLVDLAATSVEAEGAPTWRGLGVSGGVGVGRARIVRAGETPRVAAGEVLVAPVLDAAFGPALAAASAAVAEMGGILSHGAVVARELGIPCVVDLKGATTSLREGQRVLVDGGTGEVRPLDETAPSTSPATATEMLRADPADEAFHALPEHPSSRESVYLNAQDPRTGLRVVASVGVRRGTDGEALLALRLPGGRTLFAVERAPAVVAGAGVRVGPAAVDTHPISLRWRGRLLDHDGPEPPAPLPLLLGPRAVDVDLDLHMQPTTPAVDLAEGLDAGAREALARLAAHHVEQSGRISGTVRVDGDVHEFAGTGSRDHSWGRREWDAAEWWRLFTVRLGDDVAVHALLTGVDGRRVEGGFLWKDGRIARLARVVYAPRADPRRFDLEVVPMQGAALRLVGTVEAEIAVPVDPERTLRPHLAGRPWRLVLRERFTRYEGGGRSGFGMAEITERAR
jgi:phosphohistidine swiveling domain-containing protein